MKAFFKNGDAFVWITGAALAVSLLLVTGLVLLILGNGLTYFWPRSMVRFTLVDGKVIVGQVFDREVIPNPDSPGAPPKTRLQLKQGNRDLYGTDFVWVDEDKVARRDAAPELVAIERQEWGNLYGTLTTVLEGGKPVAEGDRAYAALLSRLPLVQKIVDHIQRLEHNDIGDINHAQESLRLKLRRLELKGQTQAEEARALQAQLATRQAEYVQKAQEVSRLRESLDSSVRVEAAGGKTRELPLYQIVRIYRPNTMGLLDKMGFYLAKVWELVSTDPRESNTEGGVWPAIFGTVMMVVLMSILVTPLGVLAAIYLREYARQGPFVSAVRIAVNNLAGVPSIVFGVFGVGFFIYFIGGSLDRVFFAESLPTPTLGTGGILWASLTLALLTVPVVIVATEEGLAAIPRGLREASLALGATKLETTLRVVLPAVMPSILTGLILAMARAAGEVAPLMITGVVKLAPALPLDGHFPFLHLDRKFMHLGFHIYDVGFQSPNVDAARPMVFTTTVLLLIVVLVLNLVAITLRRRLKKRFIISAV
jgi:phosphate transport system permease protein